MNLAKRSVELKTLYQEDVEWRVKFERERLFTVGNWAAYDQEDSERPALMDQSEDPLDIALFGKLDQPLVPAEEPEGREKKRAELKGKGVYNVYTDESYKLSHAQVAWQ